VQQSLRGGARPIGGIIGYPSDRLYEEVAYIAFHFHWPPDAIIDLEHKDRQRWVAEIGKIHKQSQVQAPPKAVPRPKADPSEGQWTTFAPGPPRSQDLRNPRGG
jgi:hypothetical protein